MRDCREEVGPVIYNPATGAYEALVTFRQGVEAERFACSLHFPMDADGEVISHALIRQACEMRRHRRVPLRSRLTGVVSLAGKRPGGGLALQA